MRFSEAWQQGWSCAERGMESDSNPWPPNTQFASDWERGWRQYHLAKKKEEYDASLRRKGKRVGDRTVYVQLVPEKDYLLIDGDLNKQDSKSLEVVGMDPSHMKILAAAMDEINETPGVSLRLLELCLEDLNIE